MSVTIRIKRDKETRLERDLQDIYITPIIGTCNLFRFRLEEILGRFTGERPKILKNLLSNLENLLKQYEEDKSCH